MKGAARESRKVAIRRDDGERDQLETTERGCTARGTSRTIASSECMGASKRRIRQGEDDAVVGRRQKAAENGRRRIKCDIETKGSRRGAAQSAKKPREQEVVFFCESDMRAATLRAMRDSLARRGKEEKKR